MTNNINVTEGSGKTVATEDVGSAQYQKIKVVDGTASSTTGLKVNSDGSFLSSVYGVVSLTGNAVVSSVVGAVTPYAQPGSFTSGVTSIFTGTTAVSVLSAPGASLRNYITHITVTNGSATATYVTIKDSGANVLYGGYAAASGGGFTASFPVPIKQLTTAASVDAVSSAQASIIAAASGYIAA